MKRKLFIVLLTCACTFCLAFGIAGCKQGDGGNDDALKGYIYKCSQTEHWQENSDGEETARSPHNVADGICQTCGYVEKCTEGLAFTEIKENEETIGYEVSRGTATDSHLYIPSYYNGLPVTIIRAGAFRQCESLESVVIGNNVTSIGVLVFEGCVNLETVTIPDSVTYIDLGAFYDTACYNNPENWDNDVLYIDNCLLEVKETFSESYEIKQGTRLIAPRAFENFLGFVNITIPDSVIFINPGTFWGYTSILQSITVAEGNINYSSQDGVLYNKDKTELIQVPQAKTNVTIPDSATTIGDSAFNGCKSLESVTISDSVTKIGSGAFNNCTSLKSITIPDSVTSVGRSAFFYCIILESVTIGNGVISIGGSAFSGCQSLESITVAEGNTNYSSQDGVLYNKEKTELIQVPQTKTNITIPNSVTTIGEWAFEGCTNLESITIPNSVTTIGEYAFSSCTSLINITIPDGVTSIGRVAFQFCTSLTEITIPNSVTSIGVLAFEGCVNLESVIFENPNGWYCAGYFSDAKTDIPSEDLINHATAASYLKETYSNCLWERKTA